MTLENTDMKTKEEELVMEKLESNKKLSSLNSKCIKYGIMKYGSLATLIIAVVVILTADNHGADMLGWIIGVVSLVVHIISSIFRKKYKATLKMFLNEYKIQVHEFETEK